MQQPGDICIQMIVRLLSGYQNPPTRRRMPELHQNLISRQDSERNAMPLYVGQPHFSCFRAISTRSSMPVHWLKTMTLSPATALWPPMAVDAAAAALLELPKRAASRALDLLLPDRTPVVFLSFAALQVKNRLREAHLIERHERQSKRRTPCLL